MNGKFKDLFSKTPPDRMLIVLSFVCAAVILFTNLGGGGIPAAQEGRTAIIVRNMLLSGNWMDMNVPHGIPYEKPVGHYWLCLPTAALFGVGAAEPGDAPAEWGVRLPSAISAMLALAAAALLAFRIYGARTCALTVFSLSTMAGFVHLGRLAHIDMPLAAAFAWAMYFLYTGYFEQMKCNARIYGFYAVLGWGMVLKGPLVIPLAGLVVVCMMIRLRRWKMIWELRPLTGLLVFLAVSMPWYVAEYIRTDGAFFEEFIINQNLRRFTGIGSTYRGGKVMPVYYYIPKMIAMAAPWSLFALIAGICHWKKLIRLNLSIPTLFLFFWFAGGFIFFSLSALKRGDYLLPIYVPFGILVSAAVVRACAALPGLSKKWIWGWTALVVPAVLFLILSFSGLLIRFAEASLRKEFIHIGKSDALNLIMISSFLNGHAVLSFLALLLAAGILFAFGCLIERAQWRKTLLLFSGVVFVIYAAFFGFIDQQTARTRTVKPFTEAARKIIPPGTMYTHFNEFNTELIFLMNRPFDTDITPGTRYVITTTSSIRRLNPPDKDPSWKVLLQTEEGHHYTAALLERIPQD